MSQTARGARPVPGTGEGDAAPEVHPNPRVRVLMVSFLGELPPRTALQIGSLQKHGHAVVLFAEPQEGGCRHPGTCVRAPVGGTLIRWLRRQPRLRVFRAPLLQLAYLVLAAVKLRRILAPGDIVQLNHPLLLLLWPAVARKVTGGSVFYDVFEFYGLVYRDLGPPGRLFARLCEAAERRYLPRLQGVFCVASRDGWLARRMASLNPNTRVVPNLPPMAGSRTRPGRRRFAALAGSGRVIAYAGGLKAGKGIEIFGEVVRRVRRRHPDCRFAVIGRIVTRRAPSQWLEDQGIADACTYLPWMSADELIEVLRGCYAGLILMQPKKAYHALGTGGGRKLFTYMAAGLPVIAPSFGTAWDLVREECIGLQVDTTRAEAVAAAVCAMLEDPAACRRMGDKAAELHRTRYNWAAWEKSYVTHLTRTASDWSCNE